MTRQTAYQILLKHCKNPVLLAHCLYVERAMQSLAKKFKGDQEMWGIAGLLHDADYEEAKGNPEKHGILLFELEPNSIPSVIEHAIKAHNATYTKVLPESPMDWSLYCADELTGFIIAMADQTKDKKLAEITTDQVVEKLADKHFYKNAPREPVNLVEEKLGTPAREFIDTTLVAMQEVEKENQS